jgi:DNA-3-methyladenine glycosylase
MSMIDKALEANRDYARKYNPAQGKRPAPKIAVVTCMDPRLSDLPGILGLPHADLDVIRTGGPAVTEDVLGELVVSTRVLGTTEILLLNHTGCGFTTFTDAELNAKLSASTGDASPAPMRFFSYKDPEENTLEQIKKVRSHPWIAKEIPVRGLIFDVETGLLREVQPIAKHTAAWKNLGLRDTGPDKEDRGTPLQTASHPVPEVRRLSRASLPSDAAELAGYLIGKTIVRKTARSTMSGRIVETEAYPPGDRSGHAYRGHTPRKHSLFLDRGFAYVYFIYGTSFMLNVSAEGPGVGAGVLLRAFEPLEGINLMKRLRKTDKLVDLARGPGRLATALQIDQRLDGVDLCADGPLWLGTPVRDTAHVRTTVRVGITQEVGRLLRFFEVGSPFVSGPRKQIRSR